MVLLILLLLLLLLLIFCVKQLLHRPANRTQYSICFFFDIIHLKFLCRKLLSAPKKIHCANWSIFLSIRPLRLHNSCFKMTPLESFLVFKPNLSAAVKLFFKPFFVEVLTTNICVFILLQGWPTTDSYGNITWDFATFALSCLHRSDLDQRMPLEDLCQHLKVWS